MTEEPNVKSTHIDLLEMARFLVLPGATQLLEAFARIPPGELRMSVITHAEVIARTYTSAPIEQQMPDPLTMAARQAAITPAPSRQAALPKPKRKPQNLEEEIVKLRLDGLNKRQIMTETGATQLTVERVFREARKAGVKFPNTPSIDAPPKVVTFETRLDQIGTIGQAVMARAAVAYGHSLESWVEAKATLVQMRLAMKPMDEIMAAIRPPLPEKLLWGWVYAARRAGIDLPLQIADDAEIAPAPPVAQEAPQKPAKGPKPGSVIPAPGRPVFTPLDQLQGAVNGGGYQATKEAAAARGLTMQAYFDLRESIVLHRYSGKGYVEIFSLVGQDMDFIRNTIANARQKGVEFPKISSDFNAAAWTRSHPLTRQIGTGRSGFKKDVPQPVIEPPSDNRVFPPNKQPKQGPRDFPLSVEECGKGVLASIVREGVAKGQTLEDYFAQRRQAVDLLRKGHTCSHVAKVVGITTKQAENWRQRARAAGHLPPLSVAAE